MFIKSQIIIFIYLISNLLLGIKTNIYRYFLSIIFKSSMGNSNWFSYLSFRFIKNQNYFFGIIFISLLCFLHFYLVYNFYYNKIDYTVVNTLPFIIGFFYSLLRKKIETIIMKNDLFYYGTLSFSIIIYYKFYSYEFQTIYIISIINAIFSLITVVISLKVRFNNEFLTLLNSHSYSIYLLQRVVMRFVYLKKYFQNNEFIRFFFEFSMILLISIIFDYYAIFIDKIFVHNNIKQKCVSCKDEDSIKIIENIKI